MEAVFGFACQHRQTWRAKRIVQEYTFLKLAVVLLCTAGGPALAGAAFPAPPHHTNPKPVAPCMESGRWSL